MARVLLIKPKGLQQGWSTALRSAGHATLCADSIEDAVAITSSQSFDLIVGRASPELPGFIAQVTERSAPYAVSTLLVSENVIRDTEILAQLTRLGPALVIGHDASVEQLEKAIAELFEGRQVLEGKLGCEELSGVLGQTYRLMDTGVLCTFQPGRARPSKLAVLVEGHLLVCLSDEDDDPLESLGLSSRELINQLAPMGWTPGVLVKALDIVWTSHSQRQRLIRKFRKSLLEAFKETRGTWRFYRGAPAARLEWLAERMGQSLEPIRISGLRYCTTAIQDSERGGDWEEPRQPGRGIRVHIAEGERVRDPGRAWRPPPTYRVSFDSPDDFAGTYLDELRHGRLTLPTRPAVRLGGEVRLTLELPVYGGRSMQVATTGRLVSSRPGTRRLEESIGIELEDPDADELLRAAFHEALLEDPTEPTPPPQSPSSQTERRMLERHAYTEDIYLRAGTTETVGRALDLSEGGVSLGLTHAPDLDSTVEVVLPLTDGFPAFTAQGRVVWARAASQGTHLVGIAFRRLAPATQRRIRNWAHAAAA